MGTREEEVNFVVTFACSNFISLRNADARWQVQNLLFLCLSRFPSDSETKYKTLTCRPLFKSLEIQSNVDWVDGAIKSWQNSIAPFHISPLSPVPPTPPPPPWLRLSQLLPRYLPNDPRLCTGKFPFTRSLSPDRHQDRSEGDVMVVGLKVGAVPKEQDKWNGQVVWMMFRTVDMGLHRFSQNP